MRITSDNIDYNTIRLIEEATDGIAECVCAEGIDKELIWENGFVRGVLAMAQTMKEVLNA